MNPVLSLYENRSATEKTRHPLSGTRNKAPAQGKNLPCHRRSRGDLLAQFVQRENAADQARAAVMMAIL